MKNKTPLFASFLAAAMLAVPATAEEKETRFYIAPEVGQITLQDWCKDIRAELPTASCEDGEIGYGISGGYKFNEYFSVEAGGRFASGFNVSNTSGGATASVDTDVKSFSIGGRGKFPIGEVFALTGKAGLHAWDLEANASSAVFSGTIASDNGTDPYYGVGAEINFHDRIGVRAEYTRYKFDDADADVISASAVFNF
ncbi:MAG: porin family protein [Gammaproteobacteria bacterium]